MTIDPATARVMGGASFSGSFGPGSYDYSLSIFIIKLNDTMLEGRYNAFTCVDFKAEGYTLGAPTEYGVWLSNFPVRGSTNLLQTYYGA